MILRRLLNNERKPAPVPLGRGGGQRIPSDAPPSPLATTVPDLSTSTDAAAAGDDGGSTGSARADAATHDARPAGRVASRHAAQPGAADASGSAAGGAPAHPDPRLVYGRTVEGDRAAATVDRRLSLGARRLLLLLDGRRPLSDLPPVVTTADLPLLIRELELQGMITVTSVAGDEHDTSLVHPDTRLANLKRELLGAVEAELGPQASVLEARIQDCVNLTVMRNVLREVVAIVEQRSNAAAADRIARRIKAHGPL